VVDAGLQVELAQVAPIPMDVRLRCAPGELLALVGPSGSGKTTVLRTIAGLYRPREGTVRCKGQTWLDSAAGIHRPPQHRRVGLVFQDYALFPHLDVLHNVTAALGHVSATARGPRARALLEQVNLSGLERRLPATLSGGQQQRVAIARALARDPEVLLLDEPFSAVDQVTRRKLRRELAALRAALKIPVVLVTHDLEEAAMLADRLCILHHGRTLQSGPPWQVLSRPDSVEVARLVDLQNVFEAQVHEQVPETPLTRISWQGRALEARHHPGLNPGEAVAWVIPTSAVILHRRERPSRGERENPVAGVIETLVAMGDNASITLRVDGPQGPVIALSLPLHVVERNALAVGAEARVSLRRDAIHLIPLGY
jgi:molybdate transport system ATP-binding protein